MDQTTWSHTVEVLCGAIQIGCQLLLDAPPCWRTRLNDWNTGAVELTIMLELVQIYNNKVNKALKINHRATEECTLG
jgi:hypothetical protein